jgi:hypothetical protein
VQLFVSHSSQDLDWAEMLKKRIEASGAQAYLAEYDRSGVGQNLTAKLITAIDGSDALVALLTASAASSPIVREEIGYAIVKEKYIIPPVSPEISRDAAALGMLSGLEYIVFDRQNYQETMIRLSDTINDLVRAERELIHQAEMAKSSAKVSEQQLVIWQLQARNDTVQALLILVTAIAVIAVISS